MATPFADYSVRTVYADGRWFWLLYKDSKVIQRDMVGYATQREALAAGRRVDARVFIDPHGNE